MAQLNVYQMVTDKIVAELEKGIIPWHKPWYGVSDGAVGWKSQRPYSLLNQMLLERPGEWLTWKQVKEAGGNVKKGCKSKFVVFYTQIPTPYTNPETGKEEVRYHPMLKYYNVFHIDDCEGIQSKRPAVEPIEHEPIKEAEAVINGYLEREPKLKFQNDQPSNSAYYSPSLDQVVVPMMSQYEHEEEYYSTAFHEFTHSTLPAYRCNRTTEGKAVDFGDESYSREELVAEIGAAMLCTHTGIEQSVTFRNSVAYIQSWLAALKNDNKMIVWAASRAEKAAKYILGIKEEVYNKDASLEQ